MAPPQKSLDVWAGNSFWRQFNFKQADGSAFDLTGSRLVFRAVSGDTAVRKTTDTPGSGFTITDATGGIAQLYLTYTEARDLPAASIRYEIERWIDIEQVTVLYGNLDVTTWVNDDVDP